MGVPHSSNAKAISLSMPHPHLINSNTLYFDRTEPREISIRVEKIRKVEALQLDRFR